MPTDQPIRVFEYETLSFEDDKGFSEEHWRALGKYNSATGEKFFRLTNNGVRFLNYVGVIQVGDITIEILPKIDKGTDMAGEKGIWQRVLLEMLQECNWMKVHAQDRASLQYKYNSILEAYLDLFIRECEGLLRMGLVKKYRQEIGNLTALRGRLLFTENIRKNLVHGEQFFTSHQVYDRDNIFNQILRKALKIIPDITDSPLIIDRVYNLLLNFPELEDPKVSSSLFQKLVFDRKTLSYRDAIEIAAMLILNFRPDISTGHNHVLAILFDMNDLWEEYVFRQLIRHNGEGWEIIPQAYKTVWSNIRGDAKGIKPDIVITNNLGKKMIIDTKWKLPDDDLPADSDLKQMFMYNDYWESDQAVLLYPDNPRRNGITAFYFSKGGFLDRDWDDHSVEPYRHGCSVLKASIFGVGNNLDEKFGKKLIEFLKLIPE